MAGNSATLTDDGDSEWVPLARGLNIVYVSCASWASTVVGLEYALDRNGTGAESVFLDGAELEISSSSEKSIVMFGDGESCVRMTTSTYDSSPLTLTVRAAVMVSSPSGI